MVWIILASSDIITYEIIPLALAYALFFGVGIVDLFLGTSVIKSVWKDWRPNDHMLWPSIIYWFGIGQENFVDRQVHYNKEEDEEKESEKKEDESKIFEDEKTVDTAEDTKDVKEDEETADNTTDPFAIDDDIAKDDTNVDEDTIF